MPIKKVSSEGEFDQEIGKRALSVCDFFAEWCGPCKMIAPILEQFAGKYTNVNFMKVDVDELKDVSQREEVSAMPTFKLYISGKCVASMKGADHAGLERLIQEWQDKVPVAFGGAGATLGGGGAAKTREEMAAARAAKYGGSVPMQTSGGRGGSDAKDGTSVKSVLAKAVLNASDCGDDEDDDLAKAIALSTASAQSSASSSASAAPKDHSSAPASHSAEEDKAQHAADQAEAQAEIDSLSQGWDEEMVPLPVDEGMLAQLKDMGIADARSRKAIHHGNTVEGALAWLEANENDPEIDQPYMVRKADTIPKRELTPEEKAEKLAKMTALIKQRRVERERAEKAEEIKREKERRERGQKMDETDEKRKEMMKKREAERIKKEKDDTKKEKERLLAEIARDKEIRRKNNGVMPSVLGVDGYNPSAIQYDQAGPTGATAGGGAAGGGAGAEAKASAPAPAPVPRKASSTTTTASSAAASRPPVEVIDNAIETLMKYRAGDVGSDALKLLYTFVNNIVANPSEPKYRSINTESAAYKAKLAPNVGPAALLKALGFEKNAEGKLVLPSGEDATLLRETAAKLAKAEATCRQLGSA